MKLAKLNGKAEIFYTIQGEGKSLGKPSIFIRSSLCNLHCIWCDTDYTWNWENTPFQHQKDTQVGYQKFKKEDTIIEMSIKDIVTEVTQYPCERLVLTGGEPMLHQKDWIALMDMLREKSGKYWFEVETNGTLMPNATFDHFINQYNVSSKLGNSNNSKHLREKTDVYQFFATNPKAVFKFVIATPQDLEEVNHLIETYQLKPESIFLMPEGINPEELIEKQQWLVEICKQYGFNYTDRLHIHIYGDKRGV